MKKGLLVFIVGLISVTATFSQELRLVVSNKPLNVVLNTLNVEISFDDKALSMYKVSVSQTFKTPEEAIVFLLKDKPFKVERIDCVYVISPKPINKDITNQTHIVSGELSDKLTGEPLPYAHIKTNKGIIITNKFGYFSIVSKKNQPLQVQAQYIGFRSLDTILNIGNHKLSLLPKTVALDEVIVIPSLSSMSMQMGSTSGEMRINHQVAQYMPGSADNSVFNLLRMMPGVRASGEPSEDLIVWGSNWGESRLTYDGFTIFGMKSFNDQIGSVNPYLAKDIRLSKGGFSASEGNRTGAIAEITGNEGNFNSPSVKANLSNYTANIYSSIPIGNKSAISVAYRQTFYNLYNSQNIENPDNTNTSSDIYIEPQYDFNDINIKYAGKAFKNDRFHVSLYSADDHFKFDVKQEDYEIDATEKNKQYGAAANYNRVWSNSSYSKLTMSYSSLSAAIDNISGVTKKQSNPLYLFHIKNTVQELSVKLEHNLNIGKYNKIQTGVEFQNYKTKNNNLETNIDNYAFYITDNILLGKLSINAGIRADLISSNKVYIQPRLSSRYSITEELTATASFGFYNQFLTKVPFLYKEGSYQMVWNLSDSSYLASTHYQAGLTYSKNGMLITIEGYLKNNKNQLYFIDNNIKNVNNINTGIDVFIKKEWEKTSVFGSYSLVSSKQPQTFTGQEIKLGAVYSIKHFHFSATYIRGTGFPYLSTSSHGHAQKNENQQHKHSDMSGNAYSRLDLSFIYKKQFKRFKMQTGASALNVFDTNNVKYSYRLSGNDNVFNVYTKATPFTPVIFFEIIF